MRPGQPTGNDSAPSWRKKPNGNELGTDGVCRQARVGHGRQALGYVLTIASQETKSKYGLDIVFFQFLRSFLRNTEKSGGKTAFSG